MRTHARTAVRLLALLLAVAGPTVPATSALADDPTPPVVTWPEVTRFNPDTTAYTITVDDSADGSGTLYVEWRGERQEVAHTGDSVLTFHADGQGVAFLVRCTDVSPCQPAGAASQELTVRHHLSVGTPGGVLLLGPATARSVQVVTEPPGDVTGTVTWALRTSSAPDARSVANGTAEVPLDGSGTFEVPAPGSIPDGTYYLTTHVTADFPDFGTLQGDAVRQARVDSHATVALTARDPHFYPAPDRYLDSVVLDVATPEPLYDVRLDALDYQGEVVRHMTFDSVKDRGILSWNGHLAGQGGVAPDGHYTLRFSAHDLAGNVADGSVGVSLSHERLTWVNWSHTYTAASTVVDTYVGSCSRLARPGSRGGAGSLGYFSQTSCTRPAASQVATVNGVYIPWSPSHQWDNAQVTLTGGPARGADRSYIVMAYEDNRGHWYARKEFRGGNGDHAGGISLGNRIIQDLHTEHPYILWEAGLTDGSRYDVRSFTVKVRARVLQ